jgi:hypothetical protein
MHQAELDLRLREDGLDGFRKALQPIYTGDEDVRDSSGLQFRDDLHPELRTFRL